jgi:hypothetical protein
MMSALAQLGRLETAEYDEYARWCERGRPRGIPLLDSSVRCRLVADSVEKRNLQESRATLIQDREQTRNLESKLHVRGLVHFKSKFTFLLRGLFRQHRPEGDVNGCPLARQLSGVKPTHCAHFEFCRS